MQVTAAFTRKSYLHLISLITMQLINVYTWNIYQNEALDLYFHNHQKLNFAKMSVTTLLHSHDEIGL